MLLGPLHITPSGFRESEEIYATCLSPALRPQSAYYVAKALAKIAVQWTAVLHEVDRLVDSNVLQQCDNLQDILFDGDAFSTSKRYFWAINFMHKAISLLDDIQFSNGSRIGSGRLRHSSWIPRPFENTGVRKGRRCS